MGFTCELDSIIAWSTPCSIWTVNASRGWWGPLPNETNVVIMTILARYPNATRGSGSGFNEDCFIIFKWMLRSSPSSRAVLLRRHCFHVLEMFVFREQKGKYGQKKYKIRLQNNLAVDDTRSSTLIFQHTFPIVKPFSEPTQIPSCSCVLGIWILYGSREACSDVGREIKLVRCAHQLSIVVEVSWNGPSRCFYGQLCYPCYRRVGKPLTSELILNRWV